MRSMRSTVAALVAGSILALLALGGGVLMAVIHKALTSQFDSALVARAEALRSLTRFDGTKVEMELEGEAMPRFTAFSAQSRGGEDTEYFVAWVRDKKSWGVLERSESLSGRAWPDEARQSLATGVRDLELPDGQAGRALLAEFTTRVEQDREGEHGDEQASSPPLGDLPSAADPPPRVRLLVAMSRQPLDRTLVTVGWCIAGVDLALALASIVLVRWGVARGLAPLRELSRRVESLGPDSLSERFESVGLPVELRPFAERLSALLGRLEEAFERERRFSAAASHELRTPIAELRVLHEVARSRSRSSEEWHETSGRALGVLDRAQALVEMLLRLSRTGAVAGQAGSDADADIRATLDEEHARIAAVHKCDVRLVRVACEEGATACIDPAALRVIVANLLDNALSHGTPTVEEPVVVRVCSEDALVHLHVANAAPELTDDDLHRLFEPFWRKDPSRNGRQGFGLGLAVARAMARSCGGDITARRQSMRVVNFAVVLPRGKRK